MNTTTIPVKIGGLPDFHGRRSDECRTDDAYVTFEDIDVDKTEIQCCFMRELCTYSDLTRKLHYILSSFKNMKIVFKQLEIENKKCYLIFIRNYQDKLLEELAKKYNFPRGFPIIWIPDEMLNLYGFYPKFKNDDSREHSIVDSASQLVFNYKYSGFLGQLITFKVNENYYYTTCSKNGSGIENTYCQNLYRIIKDKINIKLLKYLTDNCYHLCGEVMSFDDQTHGASVLQEEFIVTLLAKGHRISNGFIVDKCSQTEFLEYSSNNHIMSFCQEYNFGVDSIFTINGNDNIKSFFDKLNNIRNIATLDKIENLLKSTVNQVEIEKGTVEHKIILGNILEGLILKIKYGTTEQIIKFKFPFYTVRTMFLRNILALHDGTLGSSQNFIKERNRFIERWVLDDEKTHFWFYFINSLSSSFSKFDMIYDSYISDLKEQNLTLDENNIPKNRVHKHIYIMDLLMEDVKFNEENRWPIFAAMRAAAKEAKLTKAHMEEESEEENDDWLDDEQWYCENAAEWSERPLMLGPEVWKDVAQWKKVLHDHFHDKAEVLLEPRFQYLANLKIIISLGPIGSGKSSFSNKIYQLDTDKFEHIDGDILDLDFHTVPKLSFERNTYTRSKIFECLNNGKVPILSIGGGVLLENINKTQKKITFFDQLSDLFQTRNIDIILALPSLEQNVQCIDFELLNIAKIIPDLQQIYYDHDIIDKSLEYRTNNNLWKLPNNKPFKNFSKEIFDKSKTNFEIVQLIIDTLIKAQLLKSVILYPIIKPDNYDDIINIIDYELTKISPSLLNSIIKLGVKPLFTQQRLICFIKYDNRIHHITLFYDNKIKTEINSKYNFLQNTQVFGTTYKLLSQCNSKKDIMVCIVDGILDLPTAHVTINPGSYKPHTMIDFVRLIKENDSKHEVVTKKLIYYDNISYEINKIYKYPEMVELKKIFYII